MKTNNYLGKHDENRGIVLFFAIFGIILVIISGIIFAARDNESEENQGVSKIDEMVPHLERQICNITKFELSENKLVLYGELKDNIDSTILSKLDSIEIVLKNSEGDKYVYQTEYYISTEGIDFSTMENSINLDEIERDEYFIFLRIKYESTKSENGYRYRYYTLANNTNTNELNYKDMNLYFSTSTKISDYLTIINNKNT